MDLTRSAVRLWARLRALFSSETLDRELDEELRFHLDHLIAANVARGLSPEAARREALVAMGGLERRKEECRDTRGVRLIHDFAQDLRYAGRTLRRAPAFTAAAVATLALGIGATVAMFSVIDGVLLRPLPFPESERLFLVSLSPKSFLIPQPGMADTTYMQFRERDRMFQRLAAFSSYKGNLVGAGDPVVLEVGRVTTEFFDALGVDAAIGRTFLRDEGQDGAERTIVVSDELWRTRLGSDPAIVGKPITLNGLGHTVVGVMPAGFDFPNEIAAWTPYAIKIDQRNSLLVPVVGRLRPDVTIEQARAAFEATIASLPEGIPADRDKWNIGLLPLKELLLGDIRRPLQLFAGAVLVVLLIACANVANLLLARASNRDREITVRAALGASRSRLMRQLLTESLLLATIGTMLGVILASWGVQVLLAIAPAGRIPRAEMIRLDVAALAFAGALAALAGILFGLAPALRLTRKRFSNTLVPSARMIGGHERFRSALVVGEIALALVLLTGAGLLMRSFLNLRAVDPGFQTDRVVRLSVELPTSRYSTPERLQSFHREMLDKLTTLTDVAAAGMVNWVPLGDMYLHGDFRVEGVSQTASFNVNKTAVSGGYFQAMGIRLRRGRDFTQHDAESTLPVAVVSRTVARWIDQSEDVLGKRISVWGGANAPQWLTIVGVVDDVKQMGPAQASHAAVYQPYLQVRGPMFLSTMTYVVRTNSDPLASIPSIRQALRSVDKDQPAAAIGLMRDTLDAATAQPAFYARLMGIFAVIAVVLSLIGTYGLIAYAVAQRTHEIGLRMALGADHSRLVWMVLRRTLVLAGAGVMLGTVTALAVARFLQAFLFEIAPTDPSTFAGVTLTILTAAGLAGVIPARRAARVDPLAALRHE